MGEDVYDTLRMGARDIGGLMGEHAEREDSGDSARASKRWIMQQQKAIVTLIEEGGVKRNLAVIPKNLSTDGIGFFHGGFIHPGTRCYVTLRSMGGNAYPIEGEVRRCEHRRGRVHEIGVRFKKSISPRDYFIDVGDAPLFNAEAVDISTLRGTALVVTESGAERKLIADHFRESGMVISEASDANVAIDKLVNEDPDMIFADTLLADMPWEDFVRSLRDGGYVGPIVLLASVPDQALRISALTSGANEVIFKPLSASILHRAAAEYLLTAVTGGSGMQPILSELDPGQVSREVIQGYVDELQENAVELHHAIKEGDAETMDLIFSKLAATANQFGFPQIGEAARGGIGVSNNPDGLRMTKLRAYEVMKMCRRAEPPLEMDSLVDDGGTSGSDAA